MLAPKQSRMLGSYSGRRRGDPGQQRQPDVAMAITIDRHNQQSEEVEE
jgi:hypothetical protein